MKIAFFSESIADETALNILVAGILGEEIEQINLPNTIERRSSSHLDKLLPNILRGVYYYSNAEALIVVSDSDDSPVHIESHETETNDKCRLCGLRKAVAETLAKLKGDKNFRVAIGVPVPAIEAWYLFGKNPQLYEATWIRKQNGEKITYNRISLKEETYGTSRPSIEMETECAVKEAKRIVENELLEELEKSFPFGFGKFADEIRSWKT